MNSEEKNRIKQKRRKDQMRRKEYIRNEKRSVKEQKSKDFQNRKRKRVNPIYQLIQSLLKRFRFQSSKNEKKVSGESKNVSTRKRKEFSQQQKSLRKQRIEMRRKTQPMRKKIRKAKWESTKRKWKGLFRNPFRRKKLKGPEKILRQRVRRDIRVITFRNIYQSPIVLYQRILKYWKGRKMRWIFIRESLKSALSAVRLSLSFKDLRRDYFVTFLNSTILFTLAFLFVFYIHQFVTIFSASFFDIPATLYSFRIYWPLYTYSSLYTRLALVVIFGIGPLVSLILGFVFFRLYIITRFRTVFMKTFFLWSAIHGFNLFFGSYIVGVITRTGFVYSSEWLFLTGVFDIKEIIFLILSIIALIILGNYSTKHFLYTANSKKLIENKVRGMYIISKVLGPWIAGNLLLFLANIPKNPVELILIYLTTIIVVFLTFTNYNSPSMRLIKLPRQPLRFRIAWIYLILVILILAGLRLSLNSGLNFS